MRKVFLFIIIAALAISPVASAQSAMYARLTAKDLPVSKIRLNASKATIINHYGVDDTYRLIANVIPVNAEDPRVSWSSSDENIVTVEDGLVRAVGEGKATVTASADDRDGRVTAKCQFNVKATRVTGFALEKSSLHLDHTTLDTAYIGYKVSPSNATFQDVSWSSSDESVASVDSKTGLIKAVGQGRAVITASVDMGRKKGACEVVVRDKSALKKITVCAVGDLVLGGDPDHNDGLKRFDNFLTDNGKREPDYSYNLKNASELFKRCDLTVANLEVALTNKSRPARAISSYNFRGKPEYARILVEGGVDVVSVANNHTPDFGSGGVADTKAALRGAGVAFCSNEAPAVVDISGVKVAVVGIMTQSGNSSYAIRRKIRAAAGADLIIMLIHGAELTMYDNVIRGSQISAAKAAIDYGADMVVYTHPAVFSGIGKYKGKYIYFDLGTFIGSGYKTCVLNYAVTQTFLVGSDASGSFVECETPTVYPGYSSGYSKALDDMQNNCQPVLFGQIGTDYAKAMSDRVTASIKALSRKLTGEIKAADFNVG